MKKLNLGCGPDYKKGWVNLDSDKNVKADIYADLNQLPWKIESNEYDYILCSQILEHLTIPFYEVVRELNRICKNKAIIDIQVPFFLSTKYYGDPTHRIPFGIRSFGNYTIPENIKFYDKHLLEKVTDFGVKAKFRLLHRKFVFSNYKVLKWMNAICNFEPVFYERFLAGILPPEEVHFRLQVIK